MGITLVYMPKHQHTQSQDMSAAAKKLSRKQRQAAKESARAANATAKTTTHPTNRAATRRLVARSVAANVTVHTLASRTQRPEVEAIGSRVAKLARQLKSLEGKDAQWATISAKAEEVSKARYREARIADIGKKSGFKHTAPRVARPQAMVAVC